MSADAAVLIVDDDPAGGAMLALSLRQAGLRVLLAASGPEALRVLDREECAWLVTDARMRPMDGFELSLKAKEGHPDLRIAMVSAVHGAVDADGYPIEKFFAKPVTPAEVASWVGRA